MFTRLGYFVIIAILAMAGAAIAFVAWSSVSGGNGTSSVTSGNASPTPAGAVTVSAQDQPTIPFSRVIDFTRLGAVMSVAAQGTAVTVTFREDFDTSGFNTTSHVFRSTLEPGQNAIDVLQAAGIRVNGSDGVTVSQQ